MTSFVPKLCVKANEVADPLPILAAYPLIRPSNKVFNLSGVTIVASSVPVFVSVCVAISARPERVSVAVRPAKVAEVTASVELVPVLTSV